MLRFESWKKEVWSPFGSWCCQNKSQLLLALNCLNITMHWGIQCKWRKKKIETESKRKAERGWQRQWQHPIIFRLVSLSFFNNNKNNDNNKSNNNSHNKKKTTITTMCIWRIWNRNWKRAQNTKLIPLAERVGKGSKYIYVCVFECVCVCICVCVCSSSSGSMKSAGKVEYK